MKRKLFVALAAAVLALVAILVANTLSNTSKQVHVEPIEDSTVDAEAASKRLAGALRFQPVSFQNRDEVRYDELVRLREYIERTYPRVHAGLTREVIGDYSLLYTWKGQDQELAPVLLAAHLDVVPVEA